MSKENNYIPGERILVKTSHELPWVIRIFDEYTNEEETSVMCVNDTKELNYLKGLNYMTSQWKIHRKLVVKPYELPEVILVRNSEDEEWQEKYFYGYREDDNRVCTTASIDIFNFHKPKEG